MNAGIANRSVERYIAVGLAKVARLGPQRVESFLRRNAASTECVKLTRTVVPIVVGFLCSVDKRQPDKILDTLDSDNPDQELNVTTIASSVSPRN